jgi:hypothetical protein
MILKYKRSKIIAFSISGYVLFYIWKKLKMKKILLLLLAFVSVAVTGQEAANIKVDVNRELYPVHIEDAYMSEDSDAMIGVTYMDEPYSRATAVLDIVKSKMKMQDDEPVYLPQSRAAVTAVKGMVPDDLGEMCIEMYVIEANGGEGFILLMSGYRLADKAIYAAEGKKAALSAVYVP